MGNFLFPKSPCQTKDAFLAGGLLSLCRRCSRRILSLSDSVYSYFDLPDANNLHMSKLVTVVEGNPKAPFSIATASRCRALLLSLYCPTSHLLRTL